MGNPSDRRQGLKDRQRTEYDNRESKRPGSAWKPIIDTSQFGEVSWYKQEKTNTWVKLDLLPYEVATENHPQKLKPGDIDYKLEIAVHRNIGPNKDRVLCLKTVGARCPICEERDRLRETGAEKALIDALNTSIRCIYNMIDVDDPDEKIQLWEVPFATFEKDLLLSANTKETEQITFADWDDGRTIRAYCEHQKKGGNFEFDQYKNFEFLERPAFGEAILDETYPLDAMLVIPTYDEVYELFFFDADGGPGSCDTPPPNQEPPRSRGRGRGAGPSETQQGASPGGRSRTRGPDPGPEDAGPGQAAPGQQEPPPRGRGRGAAPGAPPQQEAPPRTDGDFSCPGGGTFGVDTDALRECPRCDIWQDCADEKDRTANTQQQAGPPPGQEPPPRGRGRWAAPGGPPPQQEAPPRGRGRGAGTTQQSAGTGQQTRTSGRTRTR